MAPEAWVQLVSNVGVSAACLLFVVWKVIPAMREADQKSHEEKDRRFLEAIAEKDKAMADKDRQFLIALNEQRDHSQQFNALVTEKFLGELRRGKD